MWQNFIIFLIALLIIIFTSTNKDETHGQYKVNFNGIRSERLYNKHTGEIIIDKIGKL